MLYLDVVVDDLTLAVASGRARAAGVWGYGSSGMWGAGSGFGAASGWSQLWRMFSQRGSANLSNTATGRLGRRIPTILVFRMQKPLQVRFWRKPTRVPALASAMWLSEWPFLLRKLIPRGEGVARSLVGIPSGGIPAGTRPRVRRLVVVS